MSVIGDMIWIPKQESGEDLTGTTWKWKSVGTFIGNPSFSTLNLNIDTSGAIYSTINFITAGSYDYIKFNTSNAIQLMEAPSPFGTEFRISTIYIQVFTITGGQDVKNQEFITWLKSAADQI